MKNYKRVSITATIVQCVLFAGCGGGGGSAPAPVVPSNSAPTASNVAALTLPGAAVSGAFAAADADGDALTYSLATGAANGSVTLSGTGDQDFEYIPNAGFAGLDTFTFTASDGTATSNTATVSVTVNTPPMVIASNFTTSDIGTVFGTVSASDAEGDSLTFSIFSQPAKGSVSNFDPLTGSFEYTPDAAEDGADSFEVVASDAAESSAPGLISVEIFAWVGSVQLGSTEIDQFTTHGLILNPDGSQLSGGVTFGQVASTPSFGATDIFLRLSDRRGNQTALTQFGDSGDNGVRGLFPRPQGDGFYLISYPSGDIIYRFDNDGVEIFRVPLPVEDGLQVEFAAYWNAVDDDGNIFVLSWLEPSDPNAISSGLVSKINGADGSLVWQREMMTSVEDPVDFFIADSSRVTPRGVDVDSAGDIVISGEFWDTSSMRPCSRCGFLTKLNGSSGAILWRREPDAFTNCGASGNGSFHRVTVGPDDSIYLNGAGAASVFRATEGLVAKYNADGSQELWRSCDAGPNNTSYFSNPLLTADGGVIIYGSVSDPSSGVTPSELVVDKYATDGTVRWKRRIGITNADGSAARSSAGSIAEDGQGILYITGSTYGELTGAANAGMLDAILMRLGPDGMPQ
ncbi:MAG: cadherin-like domain-containing protein [Gammaproteobacteria bacterium]|nr:cadherin-like domain-containing protein [Gammaproteobacteria bacterium]